MEEGRCAFKILTVKPTGKRPLVWSRWEDNIRMDLKELGVITGNWVDWAQDKDSSCECDTEPPGSIGHGVSGIICKPAKIRKTAAKKDTNNREIIVCEVLKSMERFNLLVSHWLLGMSER